MYGEDDCSFVCLCQSDETLNDIESVECIQSTGRFIKEQNLRSSDKLACNTDTALLTTTDTLLDWCSNDGIRLIS